MTVIDNPIINGPYDVPTRHWRFDDRGITDVLLDGRRPSESRVPVPRPRKGRVQLELDLRATFERVQRHDQVDQVRQVVERWRSRGYPHTTATTKRLLTYWSDPTRDNPILFAQREAAETAIYLAEAAAKDGNGWIATALKEQNAVHNDGLPRVALKMATGSGKTVVMAMLIAWQTLNHAARRWDRTYSRRFLLVAPGITIRDRLRVLVPSDPGSYYAERDLVPADLQGDLRRAELVITNFHSFLLRTTHEARGVAADTKKLVTARLEEDPFVETPPMMVARVLRGLSSTRGHRGGRLVVLNDEAHHCYAPASGEVVTMTPDALGEAEAIAAETSALKGDDKKEAQARNADAGVWFSGLRAVAGASDLAAVYDLSATPFFLKGSGYREGLIFPWVVSDFSLVDAIEAGIVKIPRVPVVDDAEGDAVTYLNLWQAVDKELTPSRARAALVDGSPLPTTLAGAMASLYSSYERAFARWGASRRDDSHRAGSTPPVFIVVCPNTAVSRWVYEAIAGRSVDVEDPDAPGGARTLHAPGSLPLLSNVVDGAPLSRPRSILVDSAQLESEDALTKDFRAVAADEIAAFRHEYAERTGRDADDLSDGDLLREVLNTVGKPGRLGEGVRCVVSVSMLSEGWDANTVTHVLGVRAFGSQLLCEQVVGRGLRRRSYVANEQGFFEPEYAEVYGVPFNVIPTDRPVVDPPVKPPPVKVRALVERRKARITFPRLDGYRIEVPDQRLYADLADAEPYVVRTNAIPTTTETAGLIGTSEVQDLGRFRVARETSVAFTLAKQLMPSFGEAEDRRWLFPQLVSIAQRWLAERVVYEKGTFPGMLLVGATLADAANRLGDAILQQRDGREPRVLPVFAGDSSTSSTDVVSFSTTKRVIETSVDKCHVDGVVLDGRDGNTWEQIAAMTCEASDDVAAYVKNDHLELAIPYTIAGRAHRYLPDFVVRLTPGEDGITRHLLLEVSGRVGRAAKDVKIAAARIMWCAAVNNDGRFGRWGFVEVDDPVRTAPDLARAIALLRADAPITGLPSVLEHVLAETTDDDEELFRATADAP